MKGLQVIGGLILALGVGAIGNVIAVVLGMAGHNTPLGVLIGILPGAAFIGIGFLLRRGSPSMATGILIGGCIIALLGGACGGAMATATFR